MLADLCTKPLQGALFKTSKAEIQGIPTKIINKDMCWGAPGTFNMLPKVTNTTTSNFIPHECVGKDLTCDLSTGSSQIMGDEKQLDNKSSRGTNSPTVRNRMGTQFCTKK